jgi:hypothetical protein
MDRIHPLLRLKYGDGEVLTSDRVTDDGSAAHMQVPVSAPKFIKRRHARWRTQIVGMDS